MSLVVFVGFRTRSCGCVIGRYRELGTRREITYVEERGPDCDPYKHHCGGLAASDGSLLPPAAVPGSARADLVTEGADPATEGDVSCADDNGPECDSCPQDASDGEESSLVPAAENRAAAEPDHVDEA